jgi:hypothetical protein
MVWSGLQEGGLRQSDKAAAPRRSATNEVWCKRDRNDGTSNGGASSRCKFQLVAISRCVVVVYLYHTHQVKERAAQAAQIVPKSEARASESWTRIDMYGLDHLPSGNRTPPTIGRRYGTISLCGSTLLANLRSTKPRSSNSTYPLTRHKGGHTDSRWGIAQLQIGALIKYKL